MWRQSRLASPCRLASSQRSTISSNSARGYAGIGSVLPRLFYGKCVGRAVLDGQPDRVPQLLGGLGLQDRVVPCLGHREDLGRLALAGRVALAQVAVDD